MERTFIETPIFTEKWYQLGLGDAELSNLQNELLKNPKLGDAIEGTGGVRKIRVACGGHGKRGGARVIYIDVEIRECIYLLNVYSKKEKADLTTAEKKTLVSIAKILKEE